MADWVKTLSLLFFDDGKVKVSFPMAINESFKGLDGENTERTLWHDVVVWVGLAEISGQFLKKGLGGRFGGSY